MILSLDVEACGLDREAIAYAATLQQDGREVITFGAKCRHTPELVERCTPWVVEHVLPVVAELDVPVVDTTKDLHRHWYLSAYQLLRTGVMLATHVPLPVEARFVIDAHGDRDAPIAPYGLSPACGVPFPTVDVFSMALGRGFTHDVASDLTALSGELEVDAPGVAHDPLRDARLAAACYWAMAR